MINVGLYKDRVREYWQTMDLKTISNIIGKLFLIAVLGGLAVLWYLRTGEEPVVLVAPEKHEVQISDDVLNRDLDKRIELAVDAAIKNSLANIGNLVAERVNDESKPNNDFAPADDEEMPNVDDLDFSDGTESDGEQQYPPTGNDAGQEDVIFGEDGTPNTEAEVDNGQPQQPLIEEIGGTSVVSFDVPDDKEGASKKNGITEFRLPIGFMPAKLLVGVRAETADGGKGNPKPIHLRVQAPAVLPNEVRMNLAGCFVIANTWGNLATERIEGELVELSCISKDKKTLITGELKGYIADSDSQRDMHGRVVTKGGALLARQIVVDVLAGAADTIEASAGTTQTSPLGTVKTIDGDELKKAALSSGGASGLKRTSEYLADLLVQSAPVIESGAAKDVMLMIQQTSTLKVEKLNVGDFDG